MNCSYNLLDRLWKVLLAQYRSLPVDVAHSEVALVSSLLSTTNLLFSCIAANMYQMRIGNNDTDPSNLKVFHIIEAKRGGLRSKVPLNLAKSHAFPCKFVVSVQNFYAGDWENQETSFSRFFWLSSSISVRYSSMPIFRAGNNALYISKSMKKTSVN